MELGSEGFEEIFFKIINSDIIILDQKMNGNKIHMSNEIPNNGVLNLSWEFSKIHAFLRCLNYGRINIFPKPTLVLFGKKFIINKYILGSHDSI